MRLFVKKYGYRENRDKYLEITAIGEQALKST